MPSLSSHSSGIHISKSDLFVNELYSFLHMRKIREVVGINNAITNGDGCSHSLEIGIFNESNLPDEIAFDHRSILSDYFKRAF